MDIEQGVFLSLETGSPNQSANTAFVTGQCEGGMSGLPEESRISQTGRDFYQIEG
jgi:hypothetical protein